MTLGANKSVETEASYKEIVGSEARNLKCFWGQRWKTSHIKTNLRHKSESLWIKFWKTITWKKNKNMRIKNDSVSQFPDTCPSVVVGHLSVEFPPQLEAYRSNLIIQGQLYIEVSIIYELSNWQMCELSLPRWFMSIWNAKIKDSFSLKWK